MLMRMLKSLARNTTVGKTGTTAADVLDRMSDSPPERVKRLNQAHAGASLDRHLDILYGDLRVGNCGLIEFVQRCVAESNAQVPPFKALHRPLASYFLTHYFLHALEIEGDRAECGVLRGTSALLLCRAAQTKNPSYAGEGLHLIDSFEGLDAPKDEDRFEVQHAGGVKSVSIGKGAYAAPMDIARMALKDFPRVAYHKGWIPHVFDEFAAGPWSFVHLDVDHYEPTYAGLAYFYPKLSRGGVIICDDYGAPMFPGAHRAWDLYCEEHNIPYVVLDTGQSVILKV